MRQKFQRRKENPQRKEECLGKTRLEGFAEKELRNLKSRKLREKEDGWRGSARVTI